MLDARFDEAVAAGRVHAIEEARAGVAVRAAVVALLARIEVAVAAPRRGFDHAAGAAAIARRQVAVVALLARIEHAVAAAGAVRRALARRIGAVDEAVAVVIEAVVALRAGLLRRVERRERLTAGGGDQEGGDRECGPHCAPSSLMSSTSSAARSVARWTRAPEPVRANASYDAFACSSRCFLRRRIFFARGHLVVELRVREVDAGRLRAGRLLRLLEIVTRAAQIAGRDRGVGGGHEHLRIDGLGLRELVRELVGGLRLAVRLGRRGRASVAAVFALATSAAASAEGVAPAASAAAFAAASAFAASASAIFAAASMSVASARPA